MANEDIGTNFRRRHNEFGASPYGQAERGVVIAADRLWDGIAEESAPRCEVLVVNGTIVEVGKHVTKPAGCRVVELGDHTMTPGFMDCHVHVSLDAGRLASIFQESSVRKALLSLRPLEDLLMNGFTTVRDVGAHDPAFITVELRDAIEEGFVIGPRMFVAPHLISGRGGHGDMSGLIGDQFRISESPVGDGEAEIIRTVRTEARGGADWIKCCTSGGFSTPSDDPLQVTYSQDELNIMTSTARDLGLRVTPHAFNNESITRAITAGVRSIEHGSLASAATLKLMEESGTYLVPTQFAVLTQARAAAEGDDEFWSSRPLHKRQKYAKYASQLLESATALAESEVRVVFGSDVGMVPYTENWKEFPTMVENGLSPLRALRSATSVAAEMLEVANLGVLRPGNIADIIAMPGDPLQDIRKAGDVDFVMKAGVIYKS